MKWAILALIGCLILGACEVVGEPTPTVDRLPSLQPSATVLPFASPQPSEVALGFSEPTAASLAAEGQPSQESPITPIPTDASVPLTLFTSDNVRLNALLYPSNAPSVRTLVMVHGSDGDLTQLTALAVSMQAAGYRSLVLERRGYGSSAGQASDATIANDIRAAFSTLASLPDSDEIAILATGESVLPAWEVCQEISTCRVMVFLNAQLSNEAFLVFARPSLWVASDALPSTVSLLSSIPPDQARLQYPSINLIDPSQQNDLRAWLDGAWSVLSP